MTDKEVGELWRHIRADLYCEDQLCKYGTAAKFCFALIRKLVDERTDHYIDNPDFYSRHDDDISEIALAQALADFAIDPKTYP